MLIIIGNFIEIGEEYFKKFKMQIKSYENSLGKEESASERQQIENEFIDTVVKNSIFDNSINKISRSLQQKADDISEEHRKKMMKAKRKIKVAKTFRKLGKVFLSKTLLELSIKRYEEVKEDRSLLEQEIDADWQKLDANIQKASSVMLPFLEEMVDEAVIAERMNTAEVDARRTNEELENVLGEQILGEAIQDKYGIGNVFKGLLHRFTKKNEREDR